MYLRIESKMPLEKPLRLEKAMWFTKFTEIGVVSFIIEVSKIGFDFRVFRINAMVAAATKIKPPR